MSFTCRSLLGRIQPMRPDVEPGQIDYAVQEVARRLTKEAYLMQVKQMPFLLQRNSDSVLFSPEATSVLVSNSYTGISNWFTYGSYLWTITEDIRIGRDQVVPAMDLLNNPVDIHRFMMVRAPNLATSTANPAIFNDYYDANTDLSPTLPSPSDAGVNGFFVVVAGATFSSSPYLSGLGPFGIGDVLQSDGTAYSLVTREQYITIPQANQTTVNQQGQQVQATNQFPFRWTQGISQKSLPGRINGEIPGWASTPATYNGMAINFMPQTLSDMPIEVTYACVPIGDFGTQVLPYPVQARDTIIAGALAEILAYPGEGQNLQLSEAKRREYENGKAELRSLGVFGYGGSTMMSTPNLTSLYGAGWGWNTGIYMP